MGPSRLVGAEPRPMLRDRWFADSPVEGDGFEIPVPRQINNVLRRTRTAPLSASTRVLALSLRRSASLARFATSQDPGDLIVESLLSLLLSRASRNQRG